MKERLLIKCDTTIYADEITNLLIENNIVSRQHDEGQDQNPGAYGAITGIAIYVFEKDYEKAVEIINPIVDSRNKSHVWPRPTLLPPDADPPAHRGLFPLRPTFRRPAASHRPSAALLPAADPSPSRCRTAARRANVARTCFCLFLRAACTIFVALPGLHLARPLHGRPGAGHKPLSPA